ncbi:hypothetical protein DAT35_57585 [Vitiosangium sp. GDMCC 1.1324]|nr:hypothetical protein DAT35_57585 [Vitiosangium sp. GDMCC 1.1324]
MERVHQRTAATPFALLEKVTPIALPVRGVRVLHDLALAGSYGMVLWVNHLTGTAVGVALDLVEQSHTRDESGLMHRGPHLPRPPRARLGGGGRRPSNRMFR